MHPHPPIFIQLDMIICNAILFIIEGRFQVFERFSSGKLVQKTVGSRFAALNYCESGSMHPPPFIHLDMINSHICTINALKHIYIRTYKPSICTFEAYILSNI
jgi:hypothetical protein